ncbi:MAG TPA: LacI family DNA-binding transcriptional regulator [Streptosporangiaceae bacterium]
MKPGRGAGDGTRKTIGIRDVAAAAGVSVATVSRVLNPELDYPIRQETRGRVIDAIDRLGYRPNDLARALLQRRTRTVGLVIPDIANPYYPELVRGTEDVASARGYRVVLCNTDRSPEKTRAYLDTLVSQRVEGIIVGGGSDASAWSAQILARYDTKVVVVGRHDVAYPSVQVDNVAAARTATEHLLDLGHRHIAVIAGPADSNTVKDRLDGYRAALRARRIPVRKSLIRPGTFTESSGYDAIAPLLALRPPPTAILAANDRMAFGALAALTDHDRHVPDDISLIGFDDTPLASYTRPALTTVAIPTYELGTRAMTALLNWDTATQPPDEHITSHLVIRNSCAPPPTTP